MKIKEGVIIQGLDFAMRPVLVEASRIWREYGQELVVTAALDGEHSAGSLHYYGLALDLRSRDFDEFDDEVVGQDLRVALGPDYDVIVHKSHIHVEYQAALACSPVALQPQTIT